MTASKVKRGGIYLVRLDPVLGSEIGKTRPAVVVSNELNNRHADTVTLVPITSSVDKVYPFEVLISAGEGGLSKESKAKANQIRTVDKKRLHKYSGELTARKIAEIETAILLHLGIALD